MHGAAQGSQNAADGAFDHAIVLKQSTANPAHTLYLSLKGHYNNIAWNDLN
jgi:hypothetical protein